MEEIRQNWSQKQCRGDEGSISISVKDYNAESHPPDRTSEDHLFGRSGGMDAEDRREKQK